MTAALKELGKVERSDAIAIITVILAFATLTVITYLEGKMHRHLLNTDHRPSKAKEKPAHAASGDRR